MDFTFLDRLLHYLLVSKLAASDARHFDFEHALCFIKILSVSCGHYFGQVMVRCGQLIFFPLSDLTISLYSVLSSKFSLASHVENTCWCNIIWCIKIIFCKYKTNGFNKFQELLISVDHSTFCAHCFPDDTQYNLDRNLSHFYTICPFLKSTKCVSFYWDLFKMKKRYGMQIRDFFL